MLLDSAILNTINDFLKYNMNVTSLSFKNENTLLPYYKLLQSMSLVYDRVHMYVCIFKNNSYLYFHWKGADNILSVVTSILCLQFAIQSDKNQYQVTNMVGEPISVLWQLSLSLSCKTVSSSKYCMLSAIHSNIYSSR